MTSPASNAAMWIFINRSWYQIYLYDVIDCTIYLMRMYEVFVNSSRINIILKSFSLYLLLCVSLHQDNLLVGRFALCFRNY